MRSPSSSRLALLLVTLVVSTTAIACGGGDEATSGGSSNSQSGSSSGAGDQRQPSSPSPSQQQTTPTGQAAARAIEEADIVQVEAGRLFAISKSGSLSIIDVSKPGSLVMLGGAYLPGEPFEMYLRGDLLFVMTNGAYSTAGSVNERAQTPSSSSKTGAPQSTPTYAASTDPNLGAGVLVINVKDPGLLQRVASFPVPGEIADSRIVGDILYLATYENSYCYQCAPGAPNTRVTTFDITTPASMRQVDQLTFQSAAYSSYGAQAYKRSIVVTPERMYVGGHGELTSWNDGNAREGVIDVVDITDPKGKLAKGAHLETTGSVFSRWQMDERDGILRVITQRGEGRITNGVGMPEVQMFNIWNTRSFQEMGKTSLRLPRQEGLKSVRFDQDRAYAITFAETDPLFVIDLKDPQAPRQRGELTIPGYVFHLEPHGNRVLGLGVDRRDPTGHLNVSLFDVADMDHPTMLRRVSFGSGNSSNNDQIAAGELAEDHDRIQKAFRVLDDNLIVVPFSGAPTYQNGSVTCSNTGGVQLIDWQQDNLVKGVMLPVAGNPRRALLNQGELLAVSDSNVTTFDLFKSRASNTTPVKTADLVIGECEVKPNAIPTSNNGQFGNDQGRDFEDGDEGGFGRHGGFLCSSSPKSGERGACWAGVLLGLAAIGGVIRRRR